MVKSKVPAVKDLSGYLFMAIEGNKGNVTYQDNTDKGLAIDAAFARLLAEDEKIFDIFSSAMLTALDTKANKERIASLKGKYSSKKSNIVPKKPTKAVKKK